MLYWSGIYEIFFFWYLWDFLRVFYCCHYLILWSSRQFYLCIHVADRWSRDEMILSRILNPPNVDESSKFKFLIPNKQSSSISTGIFCKVIFLSNWRWYVWLMLVIKFIYFRICAYCLSWYYFEFKDIITKFTIFYYYVELFQLY